MAWPMPMAPKGPDALGVPPPGTARGTAPAMAPAAAWPAARARPCVTTTRRRPRRIVPVARTNAQRRVRQRQNAACLPFRAPGRAPAARTAPDVRRRATAARERTGARVRGAARTICGSAPPHARAAKAARARERRSARPPLRAPRLAPAARNAPAAQRRVTAARERARARVRRSTRMPCGSAPPLTGAAKAHRALPQPTEGLPVQIDRAPRRSAGHAPMPALCRPPIMGRSTGDAGRRPVLLRSQKRPGALPPPTRGVSRAPDMTLPGARPPRGENRSHRPHARPQRTDPRARASASPSCWRALGWPRGGTSNG